MKLNYIIFFLFTLSLFMSLDVQGQDDWRLYNADSTTVDTSSTVLSVSDSGKVNVREQLDFSKEDGSIDMNKDGRINALVEFLGTPKEPDPVQIRGHRVQIYFDQDREKSRDVKASFDTQYPKVKAYLDWDAPNHYVRVGNFRTKLEAMRFMEEIKDRYPDTTVIDCLIDLPNMDEDP